MRQGNGAELLGAADPRSSSIGIIDVAPTDDREGVVAAILTQDKLGRKQIVVNLPAENKAFQRPIDFDGLKSMRRKLQAQLIVVAPGGSAPAEFARQRRFPVYSTKDNFARSLGAEPPQADQQQRRRGFLGGRPQLRPVDDLPENAAPPIVPVPLNNAPEPPASTNMPVDQEETHDLPSDQSREEDEDVALPPPIPFPMPAYPARPYNQSAAPPEDEENDGNSPPPADGLRPPDPPDEEEDENGAAPAFIPFPTPIPPVQPQMPSLSQGNNAGNIIGFPGTGGPVDANAAPPAPPYSPPPPTRRQRPPSKPPRRGLVALVAALLIVLLALIACGIFAYAAPGTFNALASHVIPASTGASVTITPKNQLLTDSFAIQAVTGKPSSANRQVQATQLTYTTPPSTKTANATGHKQTPATNATGSLTFYNASTSVQVVLADTVFNVNGGVQIENTGRVVIPAGHPPTEGSVTAPARAITSGSRGNIPAYTLNGTSCCGGPIVVSNTSAFTGGQDPQNYTFVQQSDVSNVVSALEPELRTQAMSGFNGEKKAGQQLVAEPNCTTNNSANPPVGAKASSTTVTVTATCTGEVYDLNGADRLAQSLLANEAAKSPGKGYALTGTIVTFPPHITSVQSNGTIDLVIKTAGVWVYQFSDAAKTQLAQLIAGKSRSEAQAILLQQPGVASVNISIANNGATLPTDPTQIAITIQSIPGAPTPTVTVTPGPPITPVASPTEGNG
jgi:hypothetical protein